MRWWHRLAGRPRAELLLLALTVGCALTYLVGINVTTGPSGPLVQGDARSYFAYLPSLLLDGDLDVANQFERLRFDDHEDPRYPWGVGRSGRAANPFPVGPALIWLPGYAVGSGVDRLTGGMGTGAELGYGPGAAWGAALMSIAVAGAGLVWSFWIAARIVSRRPALVATLAVFVGSPALYYVVITPLYSHAVAFGLAAAMLAALIRRGGAVTESAARWAVAGVAAGLLVASRLQDIPLLLLPATFLLGAELRGSLPRLSGAFIVGALLGYLPQGYSWYRMYGTLVPVEPELEVGAQVTTVELSRLASVLLSTGQEGWLSWSPVCALALLGLLLAAGRPTDPAWRLSVAALLAVAGMVLLDVVHPYGAGTSFGGRRYVSLTPLLIVGVASLIRRRGVDPARERSARELSAPWTVTTVAASCWGFLVLLSYELVVVRHRSYPSLAETVSHLFGGYPGG